MKKIIAIGSYDNYETEFVEFRTNEVVLLGSLEEED